MEPFFTYLLKSAGVLVLFFGCYQLFLKKETFFTANRIFLLSGLVLSVGLPFLTIVRTAWIEAPSLHRMAEGTTAIPHTDVEQSINWEHVLLIIYLIGVGLLLLRLLAQSLSLTKILLRGRTHKKNDLNIIETEAEIPPCSFFNQVVYNPNKIEKCELATILNHEKCHIRQWHSVDVLLANFLTIFQWCNPLAWWYRSAIQQNLEYLADAEAVRTEHNKKKYQYLLLKAHVGDHLFSLVNPFFNSSIKKRIVMLNKERSRKGNLTKFGIVLPLLIGFALLFNIKTEAKIKNVAQHTISTKEITQTYSITKETSDEALNTLKKTIRDQNATLVITQLERNKSGHISKIALQYRVKDRGHLSGNYNDTNGINTIHFGIGETGGIYIKSKPINQENLPAKGEGNDGNAMSISEYQDGSPESRSPSIVIVHDSVNGNEMASGKASGIALNLQDKKPLIVIDGKEMPHTISLDAINPNQIKSINVWKGKQAIGKYGQRAKDGAIEIHTKDSKFNPITYDKERSGDFPHGISARHPPNSYTEETLPLYFIDGKETTKEVFEKVDPKNIHSINVLKGEKAIKKYGQKGKNGVVEITLNTKTSLSKGEFAKGNDYLITVDKRTSQEQLKDIQKKFLKHDLEFVYELVERNGNGEIIQIKITVKDKLGHGASSAFYDNSPTIPNIVVGRENGKLLLTSSL